jgi:DNA-binding response OmpR family regulator
LRKWPCRSSGRPERRKRPRTKLECNLDGIRLCRTLNGEGDCAPVILLSGGTKSIRLPHLREAGVCTFVAKGASFVEELERAVAVYADSAE